MAKDTTWKDDIYVSCVAALNRGDVPDADYPIDETLEREKEEERMRKFDKVSLYLYFMLYTSFFLHLLGFTTFIRTKDLTRGALQGERPLIS